MVPSSETRLRESGTSQSSFPAPSPKLDPGDLLCVEQEVGRNLGGDSGRVAYLLDRHAFVGTVTLGDIPGPECDRLYASVVYEIANVT